MCKLLRRSLFLLSQKKLHYQHLVHKAFDKVSRKKMNEIAIDLLITESLLNSF